MSQARAQAIDKIRRELARRKKHIDPENRDAAWSLDMIRRLANGATGVWTYREPGLGDLRHPHPVQKVRKALDELKAAIEDCKKAAAPHDGEYLNASTLFLSHIDRKLKASKLSFGILFEIFDAALDWALNAGNALPAKRPPDNRYRYFIYELENICRSVGLPTDDEDFIEIVYQCQAVLPTELQKSPPRVKSLVLEYRKAPIR
jgi:hypothetical protein